MGNVFRNCKLSIEDRVKALLEELTLEEKVGMLCSHQKGVERLGIKDCEIGTEVARGFSSHDETQFCTVFPQTIGLAASFDRKLIHEAGKVCGKEMRAYNNSVNKSLFCFGPTVDLERDPRWGRHEEGYGEDPYLTKTMSTAYTGGIVGKEKYLQAVPLLKHFTCNNTEENRSTYNAQVPERLKMEYYYEVFREPITKGTAFGVMAAYNKLNGQPGLLNPDNQKIVKDTWGARMVVSDGGGFSQLMTAHKVTESHGDSMRLSMNAGANIVLDGSELVEAAAHEALKKGAINEEMINRALEDVFYLRFRLGEFDDPKDNPYTQITMDEVNTPEDRALNLQYVKEQVILLQNKELLPLKKDISQTIAVLGPQAEETFMDWYTGASSYDVSVLEGIKAGFPNAQVLCDHGRDLVKLKNVASQKYLRVAADGDVVADADESRAEVFEKYDWGWGYVNYKCCSNGKMLTEDDSKIKATAKDAYMWFVRPIMRPHEAEGGVTFTAWDGRKILMDETGRPYVGEEEVSAKDVFEIQVVSDGAKRCRDLAAKADISVCCVGNHPVQVGREGYDRSDIRLAPRQEDIIRESIAVNDKTILLMVSSYPFAVEEFLDKCPAVLFTTHAGPELGNGVASVLNGEYNPAGRTPSTWYYANHPFESIFEYDIEKSKMTYLYLQDKPLYPFGYGLSYSKFDYSNLKVEKASNEEYLWKVSFTVKNVTAVDGEEVPQLYFAVSGSKVTRPVKKLCGYERIAVKAGETIQVEMLVDAHSLEYYDVEKKEFVLEAGKYLFMVGPDSENILLQGEVELA